MQLFANRQNLQHIIRPDQQAEFEDLQTSLYVELDPQGAAETVLESSLFFRAATKKDDRALRL